MMRIASFQYRFSAKTWDSYLEKLETLIASAKQGGANLIVLPEYVSIEAFTWNCNTDAEIYASLQMVLPRFLELFQTLAIKHSMYIVAGTMFVAEKKDHYNNRTYIFSPSGKYDYQDKLHLTAYEKQTQLLVTGKKQTIFTTSFGKIGIAICYDSEFPEVVRRLVNSGALLIIVPSYTTTSAGHYRVDISARARAIENQCYVVTSCVVGKVHAGINEAENATGLAGIYTPADSGFPDDGIVARGTLDQEEIIMGDIDFAKIERVRQEGQVHNFEDARANNFCKEITLIENNII